MSQQRAIIVGGTSGVGLATAEKLLDLGHEVTIAGRDVARLAAAEQRLSGKARAVAMDAADPASANRAFASIGAFDHLVLALGGNIGAGPFATIDLADVRRPFEDKVFAHFATAQAALPFLARDGSLTFLSAVSGQAVMPGTAALGAANAAIAALAPILAVELKPLRVNAVSPGVIDTPWWRFVPDDAKAALFADFAAKTPVGRVGTAEDVADVVAFLIGNRFMTGATIICDGGLRLGAA
jgi:NAD(P)-dependent dehydrogenase (short-subunit alcohol dehydrogenase family)